MGIFVLRMGMIFMPMEYLNEDVYKTPAAPPYSTLPQSTARYLLHLSTNCESVSFIRNIKEFRLAKCINKATLILTVNSFVES